MAIKTEISWTDSTWSPLRVRVKSDASEIARSKGYASLVQIADRMSGHAGPHCERISAGCGDGAGGGCYSEANNGRCLPANGTGLPFDRRSRDLVDPFVDEQILMQPLKWQKPRRIFVCSQTDLFGDWWPDEMIDRVFGVMAASRHVFQILTKRPERMLQYITRLSKSIAPLESAARRVGYSLSYHGIPLVQWPIPNVWAGVTAENQEQADSRIRVLLKTPAAVRFVSYEPALGPANFTFRMAMLDGSIRKIHWLIAGVESGRNARHCNEDWIRSARDQCVDAGVKFFYKQSRVGRKIISTPELDGKRWTQFPSQHHRGSSLGNT